ncbi:hypothetical protein MD484_g7851, partial [Candolleomyces efflorescens]
MTPQTLHSRSRTEAGTRCELSPDILQYIFSLVLDTFKTSPQSVKRQALLALCQVCCSWNVAALNDARLWGKIVDPCDKSSKRFTEHLARSKGAPLEILTAVVFEKPPVRINPEFEPPQWTTLLAESHRLKNLHLTLPVQVADTELFNKLMSAPVDSLQRLSLVFTGRLAEAVKMTGSRGTMLFSGQAGALRSLSLGNFIFPPRLIPFENLEFLRLGYTLSGVRLHIHLKGWWDVVCSGEMAKLREMYLQNVSFFSALPSRRCPPVTQGAVSPNLKRISLEGDIDACVWLLDRDHLQLPPFCNLELSLRRSNNGVFYPEVDVPAVTEPDEVLSSIVGRILKQDSSHPCLKLSIILGDNPKFVHRSAIRRITITYDCPDAFSFFLFNLTSTTSASVDSTLNINAATRFTDHSKKAIKGLKRDAAVV